MSISAAAVTVELNISVWTANKLDKTATNTILTANNASVTDAAQVRKNLMSGTTLRKKIADFAAGCRLWHNTRTLPWADKGARLLPTSLFMDYKAELNARHAMFDNMVEEFLTEYPNLVAIAKQSMGTLFDAADYPTVEEVRDKFGFRLVFSPVAESGDFRLDIPQQDLDDMRRDYDVAFDERIATAMRLPWEKMHTLLTNMTAKLTETGEDGVTRRWHDSFISNAQEMCDMLRHLNITNDPKLEEARQQLASAMYGHTIEAVSSCEREREKLKDKLDNILKGFEW
jgi:hypothetical protein